MGWRVIVFRKGASCQEDFSADFYVRSIHKGKNYFVPKSTSFCSTRVIGRSLKVSESLIPLAHSIPCSFKPVHFVLLEPLLPTSSNNKETSRNSVESCEFCTWRHDGFSVLLLLFRNHAKWSWGSEQSTNLKPLYLLSIAHLLCCQ